MSGRKRTKVTAPGRGGRPWRAVAALLLAVASLAALGPARADHDIMHRERCELTHLVLEDCPNLIEATFQDENKHHWSFKVAGPIALYKKLETYAQQPANILILDYNTLGSDSPKMLLAPEAWFLFDAKGDEAVCQQPYIYAFKTKDAATKAQQDLGGKLLQWDDVRPRVKQLAADWSPTGKHHIELQGRPE